MPEIDTSTVLTIRGRRRKMLRELRHLSGSLEGVKMVVARTIELGGKLIAQVGDDVTEIAVTWTNLPMLIKRGYVLTSSPVDHTRIELPKSILEPSQLPMVAEQSTINDEEITKTSSDTIDSDPPKKASRKYLAGR
jgi:hypothetical protein